MTYIARNRSRAIARPLYAQVRDMLMERLRGGEWTSGRTLPNEFVLASHYQVSVGTIRRAVEGLEEAGIVVRKQGRGTFVAAPDEAAIRERFCLLRNPSGAALDVSYRLANVTRRTATAGEAAHLAVAEVGEVIEIQQSVTADGVALGTETTVVDAAAFPGLDGRPDLGQHLYVIFASLGARVTRVSDLVSAVAADFATARLLRAAPGSLVLRLARTAYAFDDHPIELRTGLYLASQASFRCQTAGTDTDRASACPRSVRSHLER